MWTEVGATPSLGPPLGAAVISTALSPMLIMKKTHWVTGQGDTTQQHGQDPEASHSRETPPRSPSGSAAHLTSAGRH